MRNLLFLGTALALRVSVGLGSFLAMAYALPPSAFGIVALGAAFGSLAGFLADMGSSVRTLRDLGAHAEHAEAILGHAVSAKALLTLALTIPALPFALAFLGAEAGLAFFLAFLASALMTIGDLVFVAFRALERNLEELKAAALTSTVIAVTMSACLIPGMSMVGVGMILLLSRLLAFWLTLSTARRLAGVHVVFSCLSLRQLREHVFASWAWAISTNLAFLNGQLDGILVAPLLGPAANGLYQSVARFLGASGQVSMLLISFWAPRVARGRARAGPHRRMAIAGVLSLVAAGALTGIAFAVVGPQVTRYLLPSDYAATATLWPLIGLLAFSRGLAAGCALLLVATNRPRLRLASEAAALTVNLGGFLLVVPTVGLPAVPAVLSCGAVVTALVCTTAIVHRNHQDKRPCSS